MKSTILTCVTAMTLFAALAIPTQLAAQKQIRYTVTDLGTLGGSFSEAVGVNNRGSASGTSNLPGDSVEHGFFWQKGVTTEFGTLGGPNSVAPEVGPPSERGEVAGFSDTLTPDPNAENFCFNAFLGDFPNPYTCLPFVWRDGVMTPLPTLGGNNGAALAINNRGLLVGVAENDIPDPSCAPGPLVLHFEPVIWEKGKIRQQLPTVHGDTDGFADAINANGQAVGWTGPCTPVHAVLWGKSGKATDLGNLGGALSNIAFAINNRGQVVGASDLSGDTTHHAFLWQNGVMTDLGTLPGDVVSIALSINNRTQVVGVSFDANGNPHPFLWQDGVMRDLNTLIPSGSPLLLLEALGINDRREIAGYAFDTSTGKAPAFLATPCDKEHAEHEGCEDRAEGTTAASQDQRVVLPENVRKMLQQRRVRRYHISGLGAPKD